MNARQRQDAIVRRLIATAPVPLKICNGLVRITFEQGQDAQWERAAAETFTRDIQTH